MTYLGEGQASAVVSAASTQPGIGVGAMTASVVADVRMTGGRYSLYHLQLSAEGIGAAPHFHRTFAESFQVLSGAVELFDGNAWFAAGPGDHLYVPEGGVHAFRQAGPEPSSLLMMSVPGARREDYFTELVRVATNGIQLTPDDWTELFARHDQYMV